MPVAVKNLSFAYQPGTPLETPALEDVSFTIEDGEFVGIMGQTGSGKSTLLQLLAGLLSPASGEVLVDGEDINKHGYDRDKLRRKVGVLFQFPERQLFETTVERDVAFGLKRSGLDEKAVAERVHWALEKVGFDFETVRGLSPMGLSGGEKRRAAIAGVLAVRPAYLILDEPTVGLDPLGRENLLELLRELNREGMTILMASHHADSLGELAQRLLVFHDRKLAADGPIKEVFKNMEAMSAWGLGVSQSREIAWMLQERGIAVPQNIVSYRPLLPAILEVLKGGGGG